MTRYVVSHLLQALLTVAILIVVVFFATHTLGDPVRLVLPPTASQETVDAMRERLGLDRSTTAQFIDYLKGIPRLDFGDSLWQRQDATGVVLERLPRTAILASAAILWASVVGVGIGVLAALKPRGIVDRVLSAMSLIAVSSIDFWVALMLILVLAVHVGWFPVGGYGIDKHLILPALALGIRPFGRIAQITRPTVIDELKKPYVTSLEARGLPRTAILRHVLRNSSITILTLTGYEFASIFYGASVIVETVFGWPGVGSLLIDAIERRDFPLIVATTAIVSGFVIMFHFLLDVLYGFLNPRVRLAQ